MWKIIDRKIESGTASSPFTNVYGVARSLLAISTLLTLITNETSLLFHSAPANESMAWMNFAVSSMSVFHILENHLLLAKTLCILILLLVISGWRPRYTGILHWWVNFSLVISCPLIDGGEQIQSILTLFLIPVTLLDNRKWIWKDDVTSSSRLHKLGILTANVFFDLIKIQVAVIYLHAGVGKCHVKEWDNGTALYYWFTDPVFGLADWLKPLLFPLIQSAFTLTFLNWSVLLLEFFLFAGLFMSNEAKRTLLLFGILFHGGIAMVHGLISFAIIMTGALILFLWPTSQSFSFRSIKDLSPPKMIFSWQK